MAASEAPASFIVVGSCSGRCGSSDFSALRLTPLWVSAMGSMEGLRPCFWSGLKDVTSLSTGLSAKLRGST